MISSESSVIEHKNVFTFAETFWRKIKEEMRMETLREKKPKKQLKLYEIAEEDLTIDLPVVREWSEDNSKLYFQLKENGFADFICNRESLIEHYTQLIFDHEKITNMDPLLLRFKNLTLLRLNQNCITFVENVPPNLKELHLYSNPVHMISSKIRQEQLLFLGLGYCFLQDSAVEQMAKRFPNLVCLDLTHNNLCDLEGTIESIKMLSNIKIVSLYGNPLVLLPQYFQTMVDTFVNLKFFDEQNAEEIRTRLMQAEMARQAAIQAEQKRQQEELAAKEAEAQKALDKGKKAGKPAVPPPKKEEIQAPVRLQTQPSKYLENEQGDLRINIRDASSFKITVQILTLENLDGILLDKWTYPEMEQNPLPYQSKYWLHYSIMEQDIEDKRIPYESATIENERGRIDFEHSFEQQFKPSIEVRDFVERGFLVTVMVEEPVMVMGEDGEKKPEIVDGVPKQETRVLGVCRVEMDGWLRSNNKDVCFKYRLFSGKIGTVSEFNFPYDNERVHNQTKRNNQDLIESRRQFIQDEIKKEEELQRQIQASIDAKKNEGLKGGKGKEVKKKDDKKVAKKGKDAEVVVFFQKKLSQPEKKVIGNLEWPIHERQYVFVNDNKIHRANSFALAVRMTLGY